MLSHPEAQEHSTGNTWVWMASSEKHGSSGAGLNMIAIVMGRDPC